MPASGFQLERGVGVLVGKDSRCPNAAARRRAEVRYSLPCIDCSRKAEMAAAAVVGSGFLKWTGAVARSAGRTGSAVLYAPSDVE
jgi:hypothetical protein